MRRIVIDANVAVALALPLAYSRHARDRYDEWLAQDDTELLAPTLWGYEVTAALRKTVRAGDIDAQRAQNLLEQILALGIEERAATTELHKRALVWADRMQAVVSYDSAYLALAEAEGGELWTADRQLFDFAREQELSWVHHIDPAV